MAGPYVSPEWLHPQSPLLVTWEAQVQTICLRSLGSHSPSPDAQSPVQALTAPLQAPTDIYSSSDNMGADDE